MLCSTARALLPRLTILSPRTITNQHQLELAVKAGWQQAAEEMQYRKELEATLYGEAPLKKLRNELFFRGLNDDGIKIQVIERLVENDMSLKKPASLTDRPRIVLGKALLRTTRRRERKEEKMRLADGQKPKMSIQQIKRRERAEFAKAYKDEWEARMNPPAPPVKEVEAEKGIDLHETLLRASLGLLDSKIDMRLEPLRDRVRGPRISRGFSTSARAPAASDGPSPPILPQIDEQGPDTKPIRVAFLPENDFSRYHHYEQVATVAPPHKPVVSTVNDDASLISANSTLMEIIDDKAGTGFQASEVLDEVLYEVRAREKKDLIAPREDDAGEPLTEEKKVALKVFGLGAGVWYFFGEGVARFFGAA